MLGLAFARFLRHSGGTGQHAFRAEIGFGQMDAVIAQLIFPDLLRVAHAARFQQIHNAVALAVGLDVAQRDPGIHQRRHASLALVHLLVDGRKTGEDRRDALGLADVGQPDQRRMDFSRGPRKAEIGSTTIVAGLNCSISRFMRARCISNPKRLGRAASNLSSPDFRCFFRSIPTERMFRTIWSGDSSNAK